MLTEMVNLLMMNAELDAVCGAGYDERSEERLSGLEPVSILARTVVHNHR